LDDADLPDCVALAVVEDLVAVLADEVLLLADADLLTCPAPPGLAPLGCPARDAAGLLGCAGLFVLAADLLPVLGWSTAEPGVVLSTIGRLRNRKNCWPNVHRLLVTQ
jgi:hypothetical protein